VSEQSELQRDLGRVEGKLDSILELLKGSATQHASLEARVRKVENKQYYLSGAAFAAAFVLAKVDFTKLLAVASASGH
jgi:hypothetical protein